MATWKELADQLNAAQLTAFGEPITYQRGAEAAVQTSAIRRSRAPLESQPSGQWEEIEVSAAALGLEPASGDVVVIDGARYVVGPLRRPDPHGLVCLSLYAAELSVAPAPESQT